MSIQDGYAVELGTWTYGAALPVELPEKPTLAQIKRLQDAVAELPNQIEFDPQHYFAPGMYCRELKLPADSVVIGKMHRHEHLVMLVSGEASVSTTEGLQRIVGPKIWTSAAGTKRAIYMHTDCHFITMHASHETDLDALEAELIIPEALIEYEPKAAIPADFTDEIQEIYA